MKTPRALAAFAALSAALLFAAPSAADGVVWSFRETHPFAGEVASADGRIAYLLRDGTVVLRDASTGQELFRLRAAGAVAAVLPFRDDLLLVGRTGELSLRRVPGDHPPQPLGEVADPAVALSRLSGEVVFATVPPGVARLTLASRKVTARALTSRPPAAVAALSGGAFAAQVSGEVFVFDAAGGETARHAGTLEPGEGGAATVRASDGRFLVLPGGQRIRAGKTLLSRGDGRGDVCLVAKGELRLLRGGRSDEALRLDERIRDASFAGERIAALLATNDLAFVDARGMKREGTVELGGRYARVRPAGEGFLLEGTDSVALLSATGTRDAAPRDSVNPLTTVFGASGAELLTERWRFLALAPEPGARKLHLLARRGEGRQRLLLFTSFASPLREVATLGREYDRLLRLTDEILLVSSGVDGRVDAIAERGGAVRELHRGRVDDLAVAFGRPLVLDRAARTVADAETGEPLPLGSIVDLCPARVGGAPALLAVRGDGAEATALFLARDLSVLAAFPLERYGGRARAIPDETALVHRALQLSGGDSLAWRKAGMATARELAAFAKGQYTVGRIEVDPSGLFGLFTLDLTGRDTALLSVFTPRGTLVRNLALETSLADACFGDRGTALFTISRENDMGVLRGYFLEGDSFVW